MSSTGPGRSEDGRARLPHAGVCAVTAVAALGSIVALRLGAPLVTILVVGLLLLCPLLMWVPFRFDRRVSPRTSSREGRRG